MASRNGQSFESLFERKCQDTGYQLPEATAAVAPLASPAFPIHSKKCKVCFLLESPSCPMILLLQVILRRGEHFGVRAHRSRQLHTQLQRSTGDQPWTARLSHHTRPHTHASQGDTVEPAFQAVAITCAPLSGAWPAIEDSLVVVKQL